MKIFIISPVGIYVFFLLQHRMRIWKQTPFHWRSHALFSSYHFHVGYTFHIFNVYSQWSNMHLHLSIALISITGLNIFVCLFIWWTGVCHGFFFAVGHSFIRHYRAPRFSITHFAIHFSNIFPPIHYVRSSFCCVFFFDEQHEQQQQMAYFSLWI